MRRHLIVIGLILLFSRDAIPGDLVPGDAIPSVGIIKNIPDSTLLEIVQRQTFRFFWHGAHPVSGLALERSNTVMAVHYWDYINEAWDEPNFGKVPFGPTTEQSVAQDSGS
ncbi:MAG TPA: hypothetical protein PKM34_05910, partial [Bacteroidales bacterium]|nr:hypothetical protein [Bacteroidales bacterium]